MSFFRLNSEELQEAPTFVRAPDYALDIADKDSYTYPTTGGWIWFETIYEARLHFGVEEPAETPI
jgi:hypothetical protein